MAGSEDLASLPAPLQYNYMQSRLCQIPKPRTCGRGGAMDGSSLNISNGTTKLVYFEYHTVSIDLLETFKMMSMVELRGK